MECDDVYCTNLRHAHAAGRVSRTTMEHAATRILKGRFQFGQFDPVRLHTPWNSMGPDVVFSPAHQHLALEAAQQSVVLLRNTPGSPMRLALRRGLSLAVMGPNGDAPDVFFAQYGGGVCPGSKDERSEKDYRCQPTAFTEIRKANIGGQTHFVGGCLSVHMEEHDVTGPHACPELVDLDRVAAVVKAADVVLLVLGLNQGITEGKAWTAPTTGQTTPCQASSSSWRGRWPGMASQWWSWCCPVWPWEWTTLCHGRTGLCLSPDTGSLRGQGLGAGHLRRGLALGQAALHNLP